MRSVHTDAYRAVTRQLKDARKRHGLTQQQVADRLRKPQSFIAKYERGERRLDVAEFIEVAVAIGADPVELLQEIIRRT